MALCYVCVSRSCQGSYHLTLLASHISTSNNLIVLATWYAFKMWVLTVTTTWFWYMWLNFGKVTKLSHWASSIWLLHVIATLTHYPCTVSLSSLTNYSASLELILLTLWGHHWNNKLHGKHQIRSILASNWP